MDNNIQDKIGQILSDPEAMEQLKSLGAMMGLDTSQMPTGGSPPASVPQMPNPPPPPAASSPSALMTGGFDPASLFGSADLMSGMARVLPLMQNLNREDETTRLLDALRPFLSSDRWEKLERAKQIIRLLRILPLLKNSGIF